MLSAFVVAGATAWASDARACGGCFHGPPITPTQSPSVVTDHRMVLVLDATATTLYDQVEYAGDPSDFAWVLPVRGPVVVGVGSDTFVNSLDAVTTPVIHAPVPTCPNVSSGGGAPPSGGYSGGGSYGGGGGGCGGGGGGSLSFDDTPTDYGPTVGDDAGFDAGHPEDTGVTVQERSTVGPYDVVQVHGTDEGSIVGWLRTNGYAVPADVEPMLTQYVTEGFDFVAVRLRPDVGVRAMRPIRVTFPGAMTSLPLRMVAAGVGADVGLKLFIVGDGRWHAANFDDFVITAASLTWDFSVQRSDYTVQRQILSDADGGRAFALESSIDIYASSLPPPPPQPDAGPLDAQADADADAGDTSDAGAVLDIDATTPDRDVVFGKHDHRRFTRLRADLPSKYLDVDLQVEADTSQTVLLPDMYVTRSTHDDAVCPKAQPSTPPRAAAQQTYSGHDGCQCDVESTTTATNPVVAGGLALVVVTVVRASRRRRARR